MIIIVVHCVQCVRVARKDLLGLILGRTPDIHLFYFHHFMISLQVLYILSYFSKIMMTRGQKRVAPAALPGSAKKRATKRNAKSTSGAPKAKRGKTGNPPTLSDKGNPHPSQLERVPLSGDTATGQASTSLSDVAAIVSTAVVEGIKASGLMSTFLQGQNVTQGQNSDLAASVQGSVADVIQDIAGETALSNISSDSPSVNVVNNVNNQRIETGDRPARIHQQISVPLASRIPEKIQSKIWAHEYIDLGALLHTTLPSDSRYNFVVQSSQSTSRPVISLEPAQKTKRISTIDQWITAFQTFVAVYTVRFSNEAPAMMKYSETVRDLAAKNAHWRYYDENFRFLRQKSLFPWDQIHWELWLQAHHSTKGSQSFSSDIHPGPKGTRAPFQPFPSGYCWKFHRGEKCSGCNFKHECFKCGSPHPAGKCTLPRQQSNFARANHSATFTANKSASQSRPVSSNVNTNQSR